MNRTHLRIGDQYYMEWTDGVTYKVTIVPTARKVPLTEVNVMLPNGSVHTVIIDALPEHKIEEYYLPDYSEPFGSALEAFQVGLMDIADEFNVPLTDGEPRYFEQKVWMRHTDDYIGAIEKLVKQTLTRDV